MYVYRGRKKMAGGGGSGRWVIVDTGDSNGAIPGALLMYQSDRQGDYHGEFCGETYVFTFQYKFTLLNLILLPHNCYFF